MKTNRKFKDLMIVYSFWIIYLIIIIAALTLKGCTPEKNDDFRERITGTWSGTVTWDIPGINWHHTRTNRARIVKGIEDTDLGINNLGISYYAIANLDNDSYIYTPFEVGGSAFNCNSTVLATIRGRGWLRGDSLIEEGTITLYSGSTVYTGTWETKMKRID